MGRRRYATSPSEWRRLSNWWFVSLVRGNESPHLGGWTIAGYVAIPQPRHSMLAFAATDSQRDDYRLINDAIAATAEVYRYTPNFVARRLFDLVDRCDPFAPDGAAAFAGEAPRYLVAVARLASRLDRTQRRTEK